MPTIKYLDNNGLARVKTNIDTKLATKQDVIQYSTMPNASNDNLGKIVQYIGTTNSTYTNGYFYQCVSDGQSTPTYSWTNINVQESGGGSSIPQLTFSISKAYSNNDIKLTFSNDSKSIIKSYLKDYVENSTDVPVFLIKSSNNYNPSSYNETYYTGYMRFGYRQYSTNNFKFYIHIDGVAPTGYSSSNKIVHIDTVTNIVYDNPNDTFTFSDVYTWLYKTGTAYDIQTIYSTEEPFYKSLAFLTVNNTKEYTPTSNYNPATKKYVDDSIASIPTSEIPQQDTAPSNPSEDDLWIDTSENIFKRYDGTNWENIGGGIAETLPVGTILPFADDTIPSGYLLCDGSAISRTTYATLFSIIGTTYGVGDGSTTFNLPNLKGKVPVGLDSSDSDFDTLGETGGEKTHTLSVSELPSHNHGTTYSYANVSGTGPKGSETKISTGSTYYFNYRNSTDNRGDGQAHNNLQPYTVINYIIKASQTTPAPNANIVDGYSTSTTDSYSCSYANSNFNHTIGTVLYSDSTGDNSSITLSDNPLNYDYIEIDFKTNDDTHHRRKFPNPYGAFELYTVRCSGTGNQNVYIKGSVWTITGNVLTSTNHQEATLKNGSSTTINGNNYIWVTKVIGYN